MNFQEWLTSVTTILNIEDSYGTDFFNALAPRIVESAELKILRDPELDLISLRTVDVTQQTSAGGRVVPQSSKLVIVESVSLIIPANTPPSQGTHVRCERIDIEAIDAIWPQESATKTPNLMDRTYWAIPNMFEAVGSGAESDEPVAISSAIIIAPTPDNQYVVSQRGVFRPAPLSATNQTTFISTYLPDLFIAASVVAGALFQRDFGAQGTPQDPSLARKWQEEYEHVKRGVTVESARQMARSVDWSTYAPAPVSGIPRGASPTPPQQQPQQQG